MTIDITYHESAGIDCNGNYYRGHLHPHHSGNFFTSDLRRGYFCCAPIVDGKCSDPCPEIRKRGGQMTEKAISRRVSLSDTDSFLARSDHNPTVKYTIEIQMSDPLHSDTKIELEELVYQHIRDAQGDIDMDTLRVELKEDMSRRTYVYREGDVF